MADSICFKLTVRKENVDRNAERPQEKIEKEKSSRTKVTLKEKRQIIDDYREGKVSNRELYCADFVRHYNISWLTNIDFSSSRLTHYQKSIVLIERQLEMPGTREQK